MPYPTEQELSAAGLRLEADGAVLTVTVDRPDVRNAQTPAMWRALAAIGSALDSDVRVVVLRGAGPTFSAGLDRQMLSPEGIPGEPTFPEIAGLPDAEADATIAAMQSAFSWWRRPDILSVAAVQGAAVGAGFQLALACDLRVITEDARFCLREPTLGLVPDLGGTKPLVEILGYARALEICATARWIESAEAVAVGLATVRVPGDQLAPTVSDLVTALLAAPAGAIGATKELLLGAGDRTYEDQLAAERAAQIDRLRELTTALR